MASVINPVSKQLQTPKLNGPADHVAFVIHGIGQVILHLIFC